ncbi:MAG TPA: sugar ABC transporter substrate-binding protein, partial [Ruminococcaceae bacterium]|nr:sugar ABC transporter substrate-binding protein [Oscillospiraceae bacterium]
MKKYLSSIIAIMLVASLAACGTSTSNTGSEQSATAAEQTNVSETEQTAAVTDEQS